MERPIKAILPALWIQPIRNVASGNGQYRRRNRLLPAGASRHGFYRLGSVTAMEEPLLRPYVQDDWKITRNITLNLGLRWDIDAPIFESEYRGNTFDFYEINPVSGTPGVVKFLNTPSYPKNSFYNTDWTRFAPRFGISWQVVPKTVIRAGYGIYNANPTLGANRRAPSLGYTTSANFSSPDGGVTPALLLKNGFPDYPLGGDPKSVE